MSVIRLPDLVIPDGQTASNAIGQKFLDHLDELVIHAPASISGSVTVQVTDQDPDDNTSPTWRALTQPDGTPVPIAAGESTPIPHVSFAGLRLSTGAAPTGDETHNVTGQDRGA